jgi:hypothetical protein
MCINSISCDFTEYYNIFLDNDDKDRQKVEFSEYNSIMSIKAALVQLFIPTVFFFSLRMDDWKMAQRYLHRTE